MIHVTKGAMEARKVFLPPIAEQRRIVAKLDALSTRSKRARAELERVEVLAARAKQAVLAAAFRGDLTADWRATHGPEAASDHELVTARTTLWGARQAELGRNRRCPEPEPIEWTPELILPPSWKWVSLDTVCPISEYGSSSKTSSDASGIPVLRMGNIQDGQISTSDLKYLPEDHDEFPALFLAMEIFF